MLSTNEVGGSILEICNSEATDEVGGGSLRQKPEVQIKLKKNLIIIGIAWWLSFVLIPQARPQPAGAIETQAQPQNKNSALELGIGQYKHENYEEALSLLKKARKEQPESTLAAYYLGLTYKQLQNYKEAIPNLKDAVTFSPKIAGALIELIDCLYQLGELEEAKEWIAQAEREGIRPAQVAFLKGLVFLKDVDTDTAIESFENAKNLDKTMTQACNYQIGIANLNSGKFSEAKKAFEEVTLVDPNANVANFANRYIDAIAERQRELRPWKFSFGSAWQYDDNVVLKPNDTSIATDITNEGDSRYVYTAQAEYNKRFKETFGLRSQYMFYYGKQNDLGFYDQISHTFVLQPSLYFKNGLLTFPTAYNYTIVDDRPYLSYPAISSIYNFMVGSSNMGQAYLKYQNENYRWAQTLKEENRDSNDFGGGFGWYLFYKQNKGFLNLRYGLNKEWTKGANWEYLGNKLSAVLLMPVMNKLNFTLSGDFNLQDFSNSHTVYHVYRKDKIYSSSALLAYKFYKDSELQLQYTFVKDDSNINLYSYSRNIYSAGVDIKF